MAKVLDCKIPGCTNKRAAMGRKGKNSPTISEDRSKRSSFCRQHLKGKLKQERLDFVAANPDATRGTNTPKMRAM